MSSSESSESPTSAVTKEDPIVDRMLFAARNVRQLSMAEITQILVPDFWLLLYYSAVILGP